MNTSNIIVGSLAIGLLCSGAICQVSASVVTEANLNTTNDGTQSRLSDKERVASGHSIQKLLEDISRMRKDLILVVNASKVLSNDKPILMAKKRSASDTMAGDISRRDNTTENTTSTNLDDNSSVCAKSMAVGTLGYRLLCRGNNDSNNNSDKSRDKIVELNKYNGAQQVAPHALSSSETKDGADFVDGQELLRLKRLIDKLLWRSNFRTTSTRD